MHRSYWRALIRESFGVTFWLFAVLAAVSGYLCYRVSGPEGFAEVVASDRALLADMLPRLVAAQVIAGLIWVLIPRDRLSRLLGGDAGRRGLFIATAAGMMTPGGPQSAFSLLAVIATTGADRGILVTYITSWALLGVERLVVWDVPFMGMDFSALRIAICLPLPIVAGAIARRLPLSLSLPLDPPDGPHGNPR